MKKRLLPAMLLVLGIMLCACNKADNAGSAEGESEAYVISDAAKDEMKSSLTSLDEIIEAYETDLTAMVSELNSEYETLLEEVDSYNAYKEHPEKIATFYEKVSTETDKLFARYDVYTEAYFRMALDSTDENKKLDRAFDDYYDDIYDDIYDDYYDDVYTKLYDNIYDDFYSDMFDEAYDTLPHREYLDAHSEFYDAYRESHSNIYSKYIDSKNKAHTIYSMMDSNAIYGDERDYDAIMEKVEAELEKEAKKAKRRSEEVDYDIEYEIRDDKAYITGISGTGNHITINMQYDDCDVVGIDASAFEGSDILSMTCYANIETIGDNAFKDCKELVEMSIPYSTAVIGNSAFENCEKLSELTIWGDPDIGQRAFANCSSLTEVSIGYSTAKVCDNAFDGCTNLESATIWGMDTAVGKDVFANCPKLTDVPQGSGKSVSLDIISDDGEAVSEDSENIDETESEE